MTLDLLLVDAFREGPHLGNPAAVCLLDEPAAEEWMQALAADLHCSETAFVAPGDDDLELRWFTPTVEVSLCGHATIAAAHVLWETGRLDAGTPARFHTASGTLTATDDPPLVRLDLPALPATPCDAPDGLHVALGVAPHAVRAVARGALDLLVEVDAAATVRALAPDHARVAALGARGVCVTARDDDARFDVVSRFFAPGSGIPEDPVTGSAHCMLGPWWAPRLGRDELVAHQASTRGGVVHVRVAGDRVVIGGRAVTVARREPPV